MVKIVSLGNVAAALRHTQICLVRAGEVGVRDRLVAADGFYTIGGMLEDEVIYADAYPRRIPHESGSVRRPNVPVVCSKDFRCLASAAVYPRALQPRREVPPDELLQPQDVFLVGVGQLPAHLRRERWRLD